jgi:hypothetical protein
MPNVLIEGRSFRVDGRSEEGAGIQRSNGLAAARDENRSRDGGVGASVIRPCESKSCLSLLLSFSIVRRVLGRFKRSLIISDGRMQKVRCEGVPTEKQDASTPRSPLSSASLSSRSTSTQSRLVQLRVTPAFSLSVVPAPLRAPPPTRIVSLMNSSVSLSSSSQQGSSLAILQIFSTSLSLLRI